MNDFLKRTWAEIDLDNIVHNYKVIRGLLKPDVKMMCIVKADAYGHGVEYVANQHQMLGADWFGVSNIEEARQLRQNGIVKPILILGYTPVERAAELYSSTITQSVFSLDYARELSKQAVANSITINVHLKIDTGMGRIGLIYHDRERDRNAIEEAKEICSLPGLCCDGIFAHFAVADEGEDGEAFTRQQFDNFNYLISELEKSGIKFKLRHCCNSAATIVYPEMHLDMVRPGIVLYGLAPSPLLEGAADLRPAMQLKTVISLLKNIESDTTVSYGRIFKTKRPTTVATVPIGYADGYPRAVSGKAEMLVNGVPAPVIGRICMDQCMLDVTAIDNVSEGMTVTVFGEDNGAFLPVDRVSELAGTINYETVCLIGKRVPRIFYRNGKKCGQISLV